MGYGSMNMIKGSPVGPPGVAFGSALYNTVAVTHLLLWVGAITMGAMTMDLAFDTDNFQAVATAATVMSGVTALLAAVAAILSFYDDRTSQAAQGVFGFLAMVSAATAVGAYILVTVDVVDHRNIELALNLTNTDGITADQLYNTQAGMLSAVVAGILLVRHEMAALALKSSHNTAIGQPIAMVANP